MARKKKVKCGVKMHGIADKGFAVGRDDEGMVYFVNGPVPGDVVDVIITKKRTAFRKGIVMDYISYSEERTEPFCQHFDLCGGCKWQHLEYASQLKYKENIVRDAFTRIAGIGIDKMKPILGCEQTRLYRNKLEYSFSSRRWVPQEEIVTGKDLSFGPAAGFHKAGAFDKIVEIEKCHLQEDLSNKIRNRINETSRNKGWSFYDSRKHTGFLRNLIVRNTTLGEWMIVMVFGENKPDEISELMNLVKDEFDLDSIFYIVNEKLNDSVYDLEPVHFYGKDHIVEQLGQIKYRIGPKSFFQTNSRQAKHLYDIAVEMLSPQKDEIIYDLYTGLGSIALYIAGDCRKVVGIEEIPEAIEDAGENKKFNEINNAEFITGDVKNVFTSEFTRVHGQPDGIIVDPPRAGLHKDVVDMLNAVKTKRIVYVSCNPATQARDVALLMDSYELDTFQPVDMFPHTHHIENVALLKRRP